MLKTLRKQFFQTNLEGNLFLDSAFAVEVSESFAINFSMIRVKLLMHTLTLNWLK